MSIFGRKKKITGEALGASLLTSCWKQSEAFVRRCAEFTEQRDTTLIDTVESTILHLWALTHVLHSTYPSAIETLRLQYVATMNSFPPMLDEEKYQGRCNGTDRQVLTRFREYERIVPEELGIADFRRLGSTAASNLFKSGTLTEGREAEFAAYLHAYLSGWLIQLVEHLRRDVAII